MSKFDTSACHYERHHPVIQIKCWQFSGCVDRLLFPSQVSRTWLLTHRTHRSGLETLATSRFPGRGADLMIFLVHVLLLVVVIFAGIAIQPFLTNCTVVIWNSASLDMTQYIKKDSGGEEVVSKWQPSFSSISQPIRSLGMWDQSAGYFPQAGQSCGPTQQPHGPGSNTQTLSQDTQGHIGRVSLHSDSPLAESVTVTWLRFQSGEGQRAPVVFVEIRVGASVRSSVPVTTRASQPGEVCEGHVQAFICKMRTTESRHGECLQCLVMLM